MGEDRLYSEDDSLGTSMGQLRETYKQHCDSVVNMATVVEDREHKLVYSPNPLQEPCKTGQVQTQTLSQITGTPSPQPVPLYPDLLLTEYKQTK